MFACEKMSLICWGLDVGWLQVKRLKGQGGWSKAMHDCGESERNSTALAGNPEGILFSFAGSPKRILFVLAGSPEGTLSVLAGSPEGTVCFFVQS